MDPIITTLAQELGQDAQHVANVVQLLDGGNTIPFIARYRKELHGAMDGGWWNGGRPSKIPSRNKES